MLCPPDPWCEIAQLVDQICCRALTVLHEAGCWKREAAVQCTDGISLMRSCYAVNGVLGDARVLFL
jgi:hypothetical protein